MLVETNLEDESVQILNCDDMSNYPSILTPPSSNEDSPQPIYITTSPTHFQPSFAQQHAQRGYHPSGPYLKILEQPVDRFRFRYKSEMTGTHGSLNGWSSDRTRKQTYPTVELFNVDQPAIIRCSIYQYNAKSDNMPHAHRLVKRQGREEIDDPHDVTVSVQEGYKCVFHSMGIIHTAKKNIVPELVRKKTQLKKEEVAKTEGRFRLLTTKEEIEIKGLAESESRSINLNTVCLRFDAFFEKDKVKYPICSPVYTHGINNLKSALTGELKVVRMDHCTSPAKGGREIFILVERVTKKNIRVRFYELDDDDIVVWEDYGKFSDLDVHHQYAIVFKTPPYKNVNITTPVKVYIELERPSDNARSDPKEFRFTPSFTSYAPGAKRARQSYDSSSYDSFSVPSNELPLTINDLTLGNEANVATADFEVNSADLQEALNNIDSAEFQKLFTNFGPDYQSSLSQSSMPSITMDTPCSRLMLRHVAPGSSSKTPNQGRISAPILKKSTTDKGKALRHVTIQEEDATQRTYEQLRELMKTNPNSEKIIKMLNHYLNDENKINALHVSIKKNDQTIVMFLLNLICYVKQFDLVNVKNYDNQTPLHLAIYCNNDKIVHTLLFCKAKLSEIDSDLNTALHVAVLSNADEIILEKLLSVDDVQNCIDEENNGGNTPLNLAIDCKNFEAFKMLCAKGADINKRHHKNGFTPLRFAIEKQHADIVKYLLSHPDIDPLIDDFNGISPLQAAMNKEDINEVIQNAVDEYIRINNYSDVDIEIKNEIDEISDEEIEEKYSLKLEPLTNDEVNEMYSKIEHFTPECLDEVAKILDESGSWENLAEALDLGHLMRSNLWENSCSKSKLLLKLAVESNGDTVLHIRNILRNLNEVRVVEMIDKMAQVLNNLNV